MEINLDEFKDIETKLGRKIPQSLMRSITEGRLHETKDDKPVPFVNADSANASKSLQSKIMFLKQEMAHLRAIDIKLIRQLLSINDGIESIKWMLEEKGTLTSRDGSLTDSLGSISMSLDSSPMGSCGSLRAGDLDLDSISIGSYLDTLADEIPGDASPTNPDGFSDWPVVGGALEQPSLGKDLKGDLGEYCCFR